MESTNSGTEKRGLQDTRGTFKLIDRKQTKKGHDYQIARLLVRRFYTFWVLEE